MDQPGYTDITQIVELHDLVEVNDQLAPGWRLLRVRTERTADDQQQTIYVLGLPRSAPAGIPTPRQNQLPPAPSVPPPAPRTTSTASRPTTVAPGPSAATTPSRRKRSTHPEADPEPPRPIRLVTRLVISKAATSKRRRKKEESPPPPPRELSEEEQREAEGWKQVKETGKPVLVDDKLLIPGEMSPWDAIEHLPDGLREYTRKAMQEKVGGVVMGLIEHMCERLLTELGDENPRTQYRSHPYPVQMAMAETLVHHQLKWPELPMKDVLRRYGAVLEEDLKKDQDRGKTTRE